MTLCVVKYMDHCHTSLNGNQRIFLILVIVAYCIVTQVRADDPFTITGTVYEQNPTTSAVSPKSGIPLSVFGSKNSDGYPGDGSTLLGSATSDANGKYSITFFYDIEFPDYTYYHLICMDTRSGYEVYKASSSGGVVKTNKNWITFTKIAAESGAGNDYYIRKKGGTLKVTSPTSEQTWQAGSTHTITWTQTGLEGTNVRIDLKDSISPFVQIRPVTSSTSASSGSFSWTVPDDVSAGSTYSIHVNSISDPSVGSYGWLTISAAPQEVTKTLKVTSPTSEQTWQAGSTHTITWTQTGLEGTNVRIDLKDSISPFVQIRPVTSSTSASSGSFSWKVPVDIPAGTTYSVHVTSVSNPSVSSYGWLTISAPKGIPPAADFTLSSTYAIAPLDLQITDTSTGSPTSWEWTFTGPIGAGPGPVYSRFLPVYELGPGTYTVTLTVSNTFGSSTKTRTLTVTEPIKVLEPPVCDPGCDCMLEAEAVARYRPDYQVPVKSGDESCGWGVIGGVGGSEGGDMYCFCPASSSPCPSGYDCLTEKRAGVLFKTYEKASESLCGYASPDPDSGSRGPQYCYRLVCAQPGTDRDNDCIADSIDNCPDVSNTNQDDTPDADNVGNICDNCPYVPNRDQTDKDSDGVGDACDKCPGYNDKTNDPDQDGVPNHATCDNCPTVKNPGQQDWDKDGEGNTCDCNDGFQGENENGVDCGGMCGGSCTPHGLIRVFGRILYEEANENGQSTNTFAPVRWGKFTIMGYSDTPMPYEWNSFTTDDTGNFSVVIPRNWAKTVFVVPSGGYDQRWSANYAVNIAKDYQYCNEYVWWGATHSALRLVPVNGDLNMGDLRIGKDKNLDYIGFWWELPRCWYDLCVCGSPKHTISGGSAYFNIAENILLAREYADGRRSDDDNIGKVSVQYPKYDIKVSKYSAPWNEISISSDRGFTDGSIIHEYTHYLEDMIGRNDIYSGKRGHGFCEDKGDTEFAWKEGFAQYLGTIIPTINPRGSIPKFSMDVIEDPSKNDKSDPSCAKHSESKEETVAAVLWDLSDSPCSQGTASEPFDTVCGNEVQIFKKFDKELDFWYEDAPDLCDLVENLDSTTRRDAQPIFQHYSVECD